MTISRLHITGENRSALTSIRGTQTALSELAVTATRTGATMDKSLGVQALGGAQKFQNAMKGASSHLDAFSAKASTVGKSMTRNVTLPMAAIGAASIKLAADFEGTMEKLHTLVGLNSADVEDLGKKTLKMAGDMRQGITQGPKELADALYFITSSGIPAGKAMDVLKSSAQAATAGLGSTATVADALTSVLNAYADQNLKAADATDTLLDTVKLGKVEAPELAKSIGRVIPVASAMGVEFKEVGASIAAMSLQGLDAAESTTALRAVLTTMLKPSHETTAALDSIGLSAAEVRKEIKDKGLNTTLQDLIGRMGKTVPQAADLSKAMKEAKTQLGDGASKAQVTARATDILTASFKDSTGKVGALFGNVRALVGMLILTSNHGKDTNRIMGEMNKTTGETAKAAKDAAQTLEGRFHAAWARVQSQLITIGTKVGPIVASALEKISDVVSKLVGWFNGLSDGGKKFVAIGALILIALGPIIRTAGLLAVGFKGVATALGFVAGNWAKAGAAATTASAQMVAGANRAQSAMARASSTSFVPRGVTTGARSPGAAGMGAFMGAGVVPGLANAEKVTGRLSGMMGKLTGQITAGRVGMGLFAAGLLTSFIPGMNKSVAAVGSLTATGAGLGMMFGPQGALIGGLAGATVGILNQLGAFKGATDALAKPLQNAIFAEQGLTEATKNLKAAIDSGVASEQQSATIAAQLATAKKNVAALTKQAAAEEKKHGEATAETSAKLAHAKNVVHGLAIEQKAAAQTEAAAHKATRKALDEAADATIRYAATHRNADHNLDQFRQRILSIAQAAREKGIPQIRKNADAVLELTNRIHKVPPRWLTELIMATKGKPDVDAALNALRQIKNLGSVTATVSLNVLRNISGAFKREGGFADGAAFVSPGEMAVEPSGLSYMIPGRPTRADNVLGSFPMGTAILTGHGQSLMAGGASLNQALANQLPHFAAGGKIVGGTSFGGPGDPGTGHIGASGKDLNKYPWSFAELSTNTSNGPGNDYAALGHLPMFSRMFVRNPANKLAAVVSKRDVGFGQGAAHLPGGHRAAIDLWYKAAQALHFGGYGPLQIARTHRPEGMVGRTKGFDDALDSAVGGSKSKSKSTFSHLPLLSPRAAFEKGFTSGYERTGGGILGEVMKSLSVARASVTTKGSRDSATGATVPGATSRAGLYWPTVPKGSLGGRPNEGSHDPAGRFHNWESNRAIDIMVPVGSKAIAVAAGTVSGFGAGPRDNSGTSGDSVHLKTARDEFWYEHMWHVLKKSGKIAAGALIGTTGKGAGVPHLHFAEKNRNPFGYRRGGVVGRFQNGGVVPTAQGVAALTPGRLSGALRGIDTGAITKAAETAVAHALKALQATLSTMTVAAIRKMEARVRGRIAELLKGSEDAGEQREIKRLRGALDLMEFAIGKALGKIVGGLERAAVALSEQADAQASKLDRDLARAQAIGHAKHRDPIGVQIEGDLAAQKVLAEIADERVAAAADVRKALAKAKAGGAPKAKIKELEQELKDALAASESATTDLINAQSQVADDISTAIDEHNQRILDAANAGVRLAEATGGDIGAALNAVIVAQQKILGTAKDRLNKLLTDDIPDSLQTSAIEEASTAVINAEADVADASANAAQKLQEAADAAAQFAEDARDSGASLATSGTGGDPAYDTEVAKTKFNTAFNALPPAIQAEIIRQAGSSNPSVIAAWMRGQGRAQGLGQRNWLTEWEKDPANQKLIEDAKKGAEGLNNATYAQTQAATSNTDATNDNTAATNELTDAQQKAASDASSFIGRIQARLDEAFDKVTEAGVASIRGPLDALRVSHEGVQAGRDTADAQKALAFAQRIGDPKMIAEAQRALDDAAYEQQVADLEKTTDAAETAYRAQRDVQKEILDDQLADLDEALAAGKLSYADWTKQVNALMRNNGIPAMNEMGSLMGKAFADGFAYELQRLLASLGIAFPGGTAGTPPGTTPGSAGSPTPTGRQGWKLIGFGPDGRKIWLNEKGETVYDDGSKVVADPKSGAIHGFASGGFVNSGSRYRDSALIMARRGEAVIPPERFSLLGGRAAIERAIGSPMPLSSLAGRGVQGFSSGGFVGVQQVAASRQDETIVVKIGDDELFKIMRRAGKDWNTNNGRVWSVGKV